ncbi:MAG: hypothetical protein JW776_14705 [Candidatus Lokiarchaeota archaeon]|nr:hypothetical protein [Candidatus Lokiarchaeota archaeon]
MKIKINKKKQNLDVKGFFKSKYQKSLDLEDLIEIGNLYYEEGIYYEAAKYYDLVLDENPDLIQIWKKIGNCFLKTGEYSEANMCYTIAYEPVIDLKNHYEEMMEQEDYNENEDEEGLVKEEREEEGEEGAVKENEEYFLSKSLLKKLIHRLRNRFATTTKTPLSSKLPLVNVSRRSWEYLVNGSNNSLWPFPITLACDARRYVWFCTKYGWHRKKERIFVDDEEYPVVWDIVHLLLKHTSRGGRFHITDSMVFLDRKKYYETICRIKIIEGKNNV